MKNYFLTQMMLLRQCGKVFFQPRSVVFSVPPGHLDQFLHFLFQLCVDTLYTLSFHNENQSKRREYITCTEPERVNVIKCLPFIFVTQWKILLLQFSLTFESLFFSVDHIRPTNTQRRNLLTRDH